MSTNVFFFDDFPSLLRILLVGVLAYVWLVALLRISGKRTLTKLNAFDLVVTVALGSTLATVLFNKNVALVEGFLAFGLLVFLQYAITFLSVRAPGFKAIVKSEPSLLVHNGEMLESVCQRERITRDEILAALRSAGFAQLSEVESMVLETDGSISVLRKRG